MFYLYLIGRLFQSFDHFGFPCRHHFHLWYIPFEVGQPKLYTTSHPYHKPVEEIRSVIPHITAGEAKAK